MPLVPLSRIADARSGDKGDGSNVGLVARSEAAYRWILEHVTAEFVALRLGRIALGGVERYELDNLRAVNFILRDSLGGGGSQSLLTDAQGKTHGQALLRCELDIPEEILALE